MKDRVFSRPLVLEPRLGRYRYVLSVRDAGRVLLREWPSDRGGPRKAAAMQAVLDALHGRIPPSKARRAVVAAARESAILPDASVTYESLNRPAFGLAAE